MSASDLLWIALGAAVQGVFLAFVWKPWRCCERTLMALSMSFCDRCGRGVVGYPANFRTCVLCQDGGTA